MGFKDKWGYLAKNMPLLSEFSRYGELEFAAKRWAMMLYNRPVIRGVDYFINNLKVSKTSVIDKNSAVSLRKSEIGGCGKVTLEGKNS